MATFYPSTLPSGSPSSERKVWTALEQLDSDWIVFHSVAWQAPRGGRQGDGESDFIALHAAHGIVIFEVKGGRVEISDGKWFSTDREDVRHSIKDPFRQAVDSKHALLRYLQHAVGRGPVPMISHAVAFPDVELDAGIGLYPREIVFDSRDLEAFRPAMRRTLEHWGVWGKQNVSTQQVARVVQLLAPTLTIARSLRSEIKDAERSLLSLTSQQIEALRMFRSVRRSVIRGGAGTGKTLLAIEHAKRVANEGGRPLLVCFNSPLAAQITRSVDTSVAVSTFHGLCAKIGGHRVPKGADESWFFENAATVLADAAETLADDQKFDALVVDEAQDLTDDWLAALQLLLRDPKDGPCALFLDNHQEIYRSSLSLPAAWPVIELEKNCRNTLPIARIVASCYRDAVPQAGASGPEPRVIESPNESHVDTVQEVVAGLLMDEGLRPDQVVVLGNAKRTVDGLRTRLAGPAAFVELGKRGVVVETIHRFKGLEGETIVLSLSGRPGEFSSEELDRALAYVGTSRARSALIIVASRSWLQWLRLVATH